MREDAENRGVSDCVMRATALLESQVRNTIVPSRYVISHIPLSRYLSFGMWVTIYSEHRTNMWD